MAILSNGKFYGFLCSVKATGRKLANGIKEYVEDFMPGFGGYGWKLWEYMAGKWKLEIDTIVVRETMLIFEMLISKIRAIIGAQAITQGHGKVKSVTLSDDGTKYLLELEDEDMSIVANDFVRCQTFTGSKKFYHVEVLSVDTETRTLHILLSEFDKDELGIVLNPPAAGDEIIQFGNSKNKARQSAIYLHADETGQPAIDIMFDIDSKDWSGKIKQRLGGEIPGGNGSRGFYCENGMIKGVDAKGHTVYCIYPDGSAEFGDGSAAFNKDQSGFLAGGAISWSWDSTKNKYVCSLGDVVLTWDNLSQEVKDNLKGKDANLLPWVEDWNNNKTLIGDKYLVSSTTFSGVKSEDGKLTGILQGNDCITVNGIQKSGIFALVEDEIIFELDPVNKKYVFRGQLIIAPVMVDLLITNNIQLLPRESNHIVITGSGTPPTFQQNTLNVGLGSFVRPLNSGFYGEFIVTNISDGHVVINLSEESFTNRFTYSKLFIPSGESELNACKDNTVYGTDYCNSILLTPGGTLKTSIYITGGDTPEFNLNINNIGEFIPTAILFPENSNMLFATLQNRYLKI